MRSHIQGDLSAGQFANKLLQIGDGKVPEDPSTGLIIMPCGQIVNSPDELLFKVYPNIQQNFKDQDWLSHRAILASRNYVIQKLNVTIQKQLPGQEYAYKSIDCILNDDEAVQYPIEFLNSIQTHDLQAHNLILKLDEEKSFHAMKHIMFTLGLRNQYKSDMGALQVQMYQLARIIQNTVPEVHELFDKYEVSPMLYAAPWFLTFFASHFPIGFVARLLDMLFLQGISVLFKVSALLLKVHQAQILKCNSFESIVSFLKATLPSSGHVGMEKVLDQVLSMDVEKSLLTYQIEYMVLKEEMSELNNDSETTSSMRAQVENENKDLQKQNMELTEQLQVALNTVSRLEASVTSYQSTIRKLESHVRTLQDERDAMHHSVNILRKRLDSLDLGSPPSEPELANQLDVKNVKK
ncbi:TBC1 domain family member 1 [Trichonephila clavata]|uniref:TBC1 domain family member 1 n=1 Tax=Trichonephila clavata TaxID=2740835 RepID=A0A8X6J882_TRICU|nr:TBC1 domain family member 1 [Trichonephila clavata]